MTSSCSRTRSTDINVYDASSFTNSRKKRDSEPGNATNLVMHYGMDGITPVAFSTYKNGTLTCETDLKADGKTPDTVMNFRSDGTVFSLTDFSENGAPLSTTNFAADGVTPEYTVYYSADGKTPVRMECHNQ